MPSDYVKDLVDHKRRVASYLESVANELFRRAAEHDNSKFSPEEYDIYDEVFPELQKYAYGTPELKAAYERLGPALKHHFQVNDHHPDHFAAGVDGMNLIQLIEMVCDWLAASERSKTHITTGLSINKERYHIDDQLFEAIKSTMMRLAPGKFLVIDPVL